MYISHGAKDLTEPGTGQTMKLVLKNFSIEGVSPARQPPMFRSNMAEIPPR